MKRFYAAAAALVVMGAALSCARGATVSSAKAALSRARAVTAEYDLFPPETGCLALDVYQNNPENYIVRARLMGSAACTGSPNVSVDLFFLKVRKRDGDSTTTAYTLDGRFLPLRKVRAGSASPRGVAITTEAAALWRAMAVTAEYHLSPLHPDCETFSPEPDGADFYRVDVFELHSKDCGGDPDTAPRLFSLRIRKRDGCVMTDAYNVPRGTWERLKRSNEKSSPQSSPQAGK